MQRTEPAQGGVKFLCLTEPPSAGSVMLTHTHLGFAEPISPSLVFGPKKTGTFLLVPALVSTAPAAEVPGCAARDGRNSLLNC